MSTVTCYTGSYLISSIVRHKPLESVVIERIKHTSLSGQALEQMKLRIRSHEWLSEGDLSAMFEVSRVKMKKFCKERNNKALNENTLIWG